MIYGIDISHHQGGSFDLHRARREGIEFAFLKATEGSGWTDTQFGRNLRVAREAGLLVAAYHYQRANATAAQQAAHITSVVPADVPVILDVERGGGNAALTRDLNARLNRAGRRTPLLYLPRWYWQEIGSPSLTGLPPLWYSRYANSQGGSPSAVYQRSAGWFAGHFAGYGGLPVEVLQFSESSTVAGHRPVDANAYRGTRAQLAALLGGQSPAPAPRPVEEIMSKVDRNTYDPHPDRKNKRVIPLPTFQKGGVGLSGGFGLREQYVAVVFGPNGGDIELEIRGPGNKPIGADWCNYGNDFRAAGRMASNNHQGGDPIVWGIPDKAQSVLVRYGTASDAEPVTIGVWDE